MDGSFEKKDMRFPRLTLLTAVLVVAVSAVAQSSAPAASFDQVVDRVMEREAQFNKNLRKYNPLVETYIQNMKLDKELGAIPESDRYFLGRMSYQGKVDQKSFVDENKASFFSKTYKKRTGFMRVDYLPL